MDLRGDRFFIEGGTMMIAPTRPTDGGTYMCTATNPVGEAESSFVLSVYEKSSVVSVQVMPFTNIRRSASTSCHDTDQLRFEVRHIYFSNEMFLFTIILYN